ncbi:MAG: hypothetical protein LAO77_23160 [Acidobacteriia bacterium]|nr:hypothetical protein [Terriglobia bacterium]
MYSLQEALALPRLPAALASETALVKAWLTDHGAKYRGFDFNVKVGHGVPLNANLPEPYLSMAIENSKRMIDVVAYWSVGIDLHEVKGRGDPCSVGQVRSYRYLWERDHPQVPVLAAGVICALLDEDMRFVLDSEGLSAFVYPQLVDVIRRT